MKMSIVPIVIGAFDTVTEELLKGLENWKLADEWRLSKRQHYWRRPEYWEGSRRLEKTCYHSNSSEKQSANAGVKNPKRVNNSKIVDFALPADHRIKLKECEKKDKYLDFARELKKKQNYGTWRWQLYQL